MAYIFDPDRLHQIARDSVGLPWDQLLPTLAERLDGAWPGHIETKPVWVVNLAAGVFGTMSVLHASLSEYVLLFGSAIGNIGYSGRYRMDVWDFMLAGEMWTVNEANPGVRHIHRPGDAAFLPKLTSKGYRLPEPAWMLEYGRGNIPAALPTGIAHALVSAVDLRTVARTISVYGKLTVREMLKGKL